MTRLSGMQSICRPCWREREPDREPLFVLIPERQTCAFCGRDTYEGLIVRYPRKETPDSPRDAGG